MVEAMMVTASTHGLLLAPQSGVLRTARITASSHGRAFGLSMADSKTPLMPAEAGIQFLVLDPRFRGDERMRLAAPLDRLGDRHGAPRDLGMHALDHAAVDLHHALVLVLRQLECGDRLARLRDLLGCRRECHVARLDLVRMDQRLAVEAEVARLRAFLGK